MQEVSASSSSPSSLEDTFADIGTDFQSFALCQEPLANGYGRTDPVHMPYLGEKAVCSPVIPDSDDRATFASKDDFLPLVEGAIPEEVLQTISSGNNATIGDRTPDILQHAVATESLVFQELPFDRNALGYQNYADVVDRGRTSLEGTDIRVRGTNSAFSDHINLFERLLSKEWDHFALIRNQSTPRYLFISLYRSLQSCWSISDNASWIQ